MNKQNASKLWAYLFAFCTISFASSAMSQQVDDIDDYLNDPSTTKLPISTNPQSPIQIKPVVSEHIGLLLPLDEKDLVPSSELIQKGFEIGYQKAVETSTNPSFKSLPIIVYRTTADNDNVLKTYAGAVQSGAKIIVGPLTRGATNKVSEYLVQNNQTKPITLMLNQWSKLSTLNPSKFNSLYYFPFELEQESRQVAQLAYREGKRKTSIVYFNSSLNRKFAEQYASEFQKLGGTVFQQVPITTDPNSFNQLRKALQVAKANRVDSVFYSADTEKAKFIKPFIDEFKFESYTTNQILDATTKIASELNNSKLTVMPYFDENRPDSKVIDKKALSNLDQIRLFSFGYDAGKLTQLLQDFAPVAFGFEFEGLTGKMTLDNLNRFDRELLPMTYTPTGLTSWNPDLIKPQEVLKPITKPTVRKPKVITPTTGTSPQPLVAKPVPKVVKAKTL